MQWKQRSRRWLITAALLATACGDAAGDVFGNEEGGPTNDLPQGGGGGEADDGANGGGFGGGTTGGALPPETEETIAFQKPQAGATSVYVPNPLTNRVAIVNAQNFAIETVRAGDGPTYTATVPGQDLAVVLNVASRDATILRTTNGTTTTTTVPVGYEANAIAISPDGAHAVVYFDARDPTRKADSFQDVTLIDLKSEPATSRGVSVGFRPRDVLFSTDGSQAFVITEDGISVVDLNNQGQAIARLISVGDTLKDSSLATDISITPDGAYAIARKANATILRLINLQTGAIQALDLKVLQAAADAGPSAATPLSAGTLEITDLDLAPAGTFALAIARSHGAMIRVPIPGGFTDPTSILVTKIEEQVVGSATIAPSGQLAVLHTTASNAEGIVLVDLFAGGAPRGVRLRKTVRAVAISEDGTRVFVLHDRSATPANGGGTVDEEARIDRSEGYSLVDTVSGFAKLQLTPAAVSVDQLVVTENTARMFALLRDDATGVNAVQTADLSSFQVDTVELVAPPTSIGLVPEAERVFIGQELSGGMITFLDWNTGEVEKSVTGFELTSRIRQ